MRYREVATGALVDADQIRPHICVAADAVTMRVRTPAGVVSAVAGDWLVGRRDGSVGGFQSADFDTRFVPHAPPERPPEWSRRTKRDKQKGGKF